MNDLELLPLLKFKLNLKHPNLEDCYIEGYEAQSAQIKEEENPYLINTRAYEEWSNGWWSAFYEETPLFKNEIIQQEAIDKSDTINSLDSSSLKKKSAVNDKIFYKKPLISSLLFRLAGALTAMAIVGYQVVDLVI